MFFKRKELLDDFNHLIKIYFTFKLSSIEDQLQSLLASYQELSGIKITEFSLNYKKDCKIGVLINKRIGVSDLDSILFFSESDFGFDISKTPLTNSIGVYEVRFLFPRKSFDDNKLIFTMVNFLIVNFNVVYGYSRVLPKNFSRVSESEIKKSLLGSVSVDSAPFNDNWFFPPEHMLSNGIKGVYPLNFIGAGAMENPLLKRVTGLDGVSILPINEYIKCVRVPSNILEVLRKDKNIRKYIWS